MSTNKTVLVTGGAGYIGSHTCKALAEAGYLPVTFDNLSTGHRDFVQWGPLEVGDIKDYSRLIDVLNKHQPSATIHFAASAYVGESVRNPMKYYQNNIVGSTTLIKALVDKKVSKFVFSSTCATYGTPNVKQISENCEQNPINPYGFTKLVIEQCLKDMAAIDTLKYVSLRYFNAAGADKAGMIGEKHEPETHLIPLAIHSAMGGEELQVFGTDFDTPDGSQVRDYIHVSDLASAHVLALKYLEGKGDSVALNLGTGMGTSVLQVIKALEDVLGEVRSQRGSRREGDPAYLVADPKMAINLLSWSPKYTNIKDILETAVNWHRKNGF